MVLKIWYALAYAATVLADYDIFYFTSNKASWRCQGLGFDCPPPSVCSHDPLIDKYYCCFPGPDSVCWTGSTTCSGANSQSASSAQIDCGSYCCLKNREQCTQRVGQFNICWGTQENPIANNTNRQLNDTFSSISSARPSATSYPFRLAAIVGASTTSLPSSTQSNSASKISTTTTLTTSRSATTSGASTATPTSSSGSGSGISGGAIAGVVIGALAGLAILAALIFLLLRRRRRAKAAPGAPTTAVSELPNQPAGPPTQQYMSEMDAGRGRYAPVAEADSVPAGAYKPTPQPQVISELEAR